jgi:DNA-directed RNA polymerase specialized sigma24 family protein
MPPEPGSITRLIGELRADNPVAHAVLWDRFAQRMLALARQRLRHTPRRLADEEDVVVGAFERFLRGVRDGRFPKLNDRNDLWAVLFTLTVRVASRQAEEVRRLKRGGGKVRGDSALHDRNGQPIEIPDDNPGPDEEVILRDGLDFLLAELDDDELRRIALARLEGHTLPEIAELIGRSPMTVARRFTLIRKIWENSTFMKNP